MFPVVHPAVTVVAVLFQEVGYPWYSDYAWAGFSGVPVLFPACVRVLPFRLSVEAGSVIHPVLFGGYRELVLRGKAA